jgi:hypothetical protein
MIEILFLIIGLVAWIYGLFLLGKANSDFFYYMLYAPIIFILLLMSVTSLESVLSLIYSLESWTLILVLLTVVERIAWGITLKEIAGEDKLIWFYLTYTTPFMWFIYRIVKIR